MLWNMANMILGDKSVSFETKQEARDYATTHNLVERLEEHEHIVGTSIVTAGNGTAYRIRVDVNMKIQGIDLKTDVTITDRSELKHKMIIGKRDLKQFLVDPSK